MASVLLEAGAAHSLATKVRGGLVTLGGREARVGAPAPLGRLQSADPAQAFGFFLSEYFRFVLWMIKGDCETPRPIRGRGAASVLPINASVISSAANQCFSGDGVRKARAACPALSIVKPTVLPRGKKQAFQTHRTSLSMRERKPPRIGSTVCEESSSTYRLTSSRIFPALASAGIRWHPLSAL